MNKATARRELQRLIDKAPKIAPSITRCKWQNYGEVTDEGFEPQKAQRWEVEATSLLQGLASSGGQPFALLNGQYHERKAKAANYHGRSIFIHEAVQCLTTAVELLDSAVANIVIPERQHYVAAAAELETPQHVTIPWLLKHVSVSLWFTAAGLLVAAFLLGVKVAGFPLLQSIFGILGTAHTP